MNIIIVALITGVALLLILPWLAPYLDRLYNWVEDYPPLKWWMKYIDWVWDRQEKKRWNKQ